MRDSFPRPRNRNENNLKMFTRINWRASLVPAAAVIPAPIAYIKVVAVKKLVVELRMWLGGPPPGVYCLAVFSFLVSQYAPYWVCWGTMTLTLRQLECSKHAYAPIH